VPHQCHQDDAHALDIITNILHGTRWRPDTIEDIAAVLRQTGRTISDLVDHQCLDNGARASGRGDILATTENDNA
jgi:hypothetical protein